MRSVRRSRTCSRIRARSSSPPARWRWRELKKYLAREGWREKRLVAINSGANMNFDRLRHVAERADLGGEREALLAVVIPEKPGSFLRFCEVIGGRSVTEFNYRYAGADSAQIFVGLALTQGRAEKDAVLASLRAAGFAVTDMTDDEMAKLHVRYMVGGHARGIAHEVLYRFEFPERPGALQRFLKSIGARWNITPVPLPQPRLRLRPRARGHPGAAGRARRLRPAPERAALRVRGGDRQPRLPHVPRHLRRAARPVAGCSRPATRATPRAAPRGSPAR